MTHVLGREIWGGGCTDLCSWGGFRAWSLFLSPPRGASSWWARGGGACLTHATSCLSQCPGEEEGALPRRPLAEQGRLIPGWARYAPLGELRVWGGREAGCCDLWNGGGCFAAHRMAVSTCASRGVGGMLVPAPVCTWPLPDTRFWEIWAPPRGSTGLAPCSPESLAVPPPSAVLVVQDPSGSSLGWGLQNPGGAVSCKSQPFGGGGGGPAISLLCAPGHLSCSHDASLARCSRGLVAPRSFACLVPSVSFCPLRSYTPAARTTGLWTQESGSPF